MSIAITTVWPAPGRHLQGQPWQAVVVQQVLRLRPAPAVDGAVPAGDLGAEDRGLRGLALAEQHRVVADRRRGRPSV